MADPNPWICANAFDSARILCSAGGYPGPFSFRQSFDFLDTPFTCGTNRASKNGVERGGLHGRGDGATCQTVCRRRASRTLKMRTIRWLVVYASSKLAISSTLGSKRHPCILHSSDSSIIFDGLPDWST